MSYCEKLLVAMDALSARRSSCGSQVGGCGEMKITYLTKLEHAGILAAPGFKRLKQLKKRSAKQTTEVRDGE